MADLFEGYELGGGWDETFSEPFKGLYSGTASSTLTVSVEVTRL